MHCPSYFAYLQIISSSSFAILCSLDNSHIFILCYISFVHFFLFLVFELYNFRWQTESSSWQEFAIFMRIKTNQYIFSHLSKKNNNNWEIHIFSCEISISQVSAMEIDGYVSRGLDCQVLNWKTVLLSLHTLHHITHNIREIVPRTLFHFLSPFLFARY